jgi:pimeloyl-ACP methyl ester carboxylesterase
MRLAARSPELIRSLVLIDTAADAEPPWSRLKYGVLGVVARVLGMRPVLGETMKAMFGRTFLTDPARAADREEMKSRLRANDVAGTVRALGGVSSRASVEDELPAIRCPTLVVTGEEDVSVAPARSERTARAIAAAQLVRIPRAGHSSTLEEPQAVSGAIGAFLDGVSARAGAVQGGAAAGPVNG